MSDWNTPKQPKIAYRLEAYVPNLAGSSVSTLGVWNEDNALELALKDLKTWSEAQPNWDFKLLKMTTVVTVENITPTTD